jgi:nucleotide-binding universal stress UspA family protein
MGRKSDVAFIAPYRVSTSMYRTILIPTDGSDRANRAVEHAIELAETYDADLHGMYVVDTTRYGDPALSSAELILTELEDRGDIILTEILEEAEPLGIDFTPYICHGSPHEEIIIYADEIDADVIVIGYQGESHPETDLMGSVVQRVLEATDRTVLIA